MSIYVYKRSQEEQIYGEWLVIIEHEYIERFYKRDDALHYCEACQASGDSAYVIHESSYSEILF